MTDILELDEIYVVDLETTGLTGYPYDKILQIAICKLFPKKYRYEIMLNTTIKQEITRKISNCYIVDLSPQILEEIPFGIPLEKVVLKTKEILKNNHYTTYNTGYDYDKFLSYSDWNLHKPLFCLMTKMTPICNIPHKYFGIKYPTLEEAYYYFFKKTFKNQHTAIGDTIASSKVLMKYIQLMKKKKKTITKIQHKLNK